MEAKEKETERKLTKSAQCAFHDRQSLVGPGALQCLLHPYFEDHLGWKYNFIYVTCICNIDGR